MINVNIIFKTMMFLWAFFDSKCTSVSDFNSQELVPSC